MVQEVTETETEETAAEARARRKVQIKEFRSIREQIERAITTLGQSLRADDLELVEGQIAKPQQDLEKLREIHDEGNSIQARSVARVTDDLARFIQKFEASRNKKKKSRARKKTGTRTTAKAGIPETDFEWVMNALYLVERDHKEEISDLHARRCGEFKSLFESLGCIDAVKLKTFNNYLRKYKFKHLFDREEVWKRVASSKT